MKNLISLKSVFYTSLSVSVLFVLLFSCKPQPPENSLAMQAERGKSHFMKYCSQCHGMDGRGLRIDSLSNQPADLTKITADQETTTFPIQRIARKIDGRAMSAAHKTRDMPIWGEVFSEGEHLSENEIRGKMGELIAYLITIQKPD